MSAVAKLAAFAAALVAVFAVAIAAGAAIGPDSEGDSRASTDGSHEETNTSHGGDGEHAGAQEDDMTSTPKTDEVRGLAVARDGLKLVLEDKDLTAGKPGELRFRIAGTDGKTVRDFEVEHDKRMHLIVVRRDGRGFQHLHPELREDGTWAVNATLPDPGSYRVFADFKRGDEAQTLAADLFVDGDADYRPLPEPAATADAGDGYEVTLDAGRVRAGREADLRFTVKKDGQAVHTEPYLGAGGHLVALREGDLAYLHVHPGGHGDGAESEAHDDAVAFVSEFPSEGRYRLYLQFKHEGRVRTAEFTQDVER